MNKPPGMRRRDTVLGGSLREDDRGVVIEGRDSRKKSHGHGKGHKKGHRKGHGNGGEDGEE